MQENEKPEKRIAEAPDGYEYIWAVNPGLIVKHSPENGFIEINKKGAEYFQFMELKLKRTKKLHTYEGRRCIFVDMPVFEIEEAHDD